MDNEITYSYKEVAEKLGLGSSAVYQKIKRNHMFYKSYLRQKGGKTYITIEGFELLKNNAHKDKSSPNYTNYVKNNTQCEIEELKLENQKLKQQNEDLITELLQTKNLLLEEKDKTINALLEAYTQKHNVLEAENQKNIEIKKENFWTRLWKN